MISKKKLQKILETLICSCLILFFLVQFVPVKNLKAETTLLSDNFNPDINVNNVLAISTEFDKVLFSQQATTPIPLPAVNHLMLSLLVVEELNLDQRITISQNALSYAKSDPSSLARDIENNENVLISNLLALHMYEHSSVAAVALAEELTGSIDKSLEKMNKRAKELGMETTNFVNILGDITLNDKKTWNPNFDLIEDSDFLAQKSSLEDLAVLMKVINKNNLLSEIFSEGDYFTRLVDDTVIALQHPYDLIFATTEQGINSGWALQHNDMSFSLVQGEINQIQYLILMTDKTSNSFAVDMIDLIKEITDHYKVSRIVSQNQIYPNYDQTTEGDQISLMFLKKINYIHPKSDSFVNSAVKYVSYGPHTRPLARGTPVGQVIFTLNDGSQIEAEVGSDVSILSNYTFISKFINSIQQNPNLGKIIFFLTVILCLTLIVRIRYLILALFRQIKLLKLNKLQQGLKDRIKNPK